MYIAYIGIGSNLGNREDNCERAISLLSTNGLNIIKKSSMIETEPWGVLDQPAFINIAVSVKTILSPEKLLALCKKIETDVGRTETIMWGPRIIDLDILFYDELVIEKSGLSIPHPHIKDRAFVLKSLAEIAPDFVHPVLNKSIKELLAECLTTDY
jgi:2-amino-4-hydroxy-6-hydroxymethyldihydropteridine diphosphokinase